MLYRHSIWTNYLIKNNFFTFLVFICHVRYLFIFSAVQQNKTKAMTIVNSHNDWDPLEEIIIGVSDFWCVPNEEPGFKPPQR